MNALRSFTAILFGIAFMATTARILGPVLAAVFGVAGVLAGNGIAAVIAGWLAARIAGYAEFKHAIALAAAIGLLTVVVILGGPPPGEPPQPGWYGPVVGLIGICGVLLGGWLRAAAADAARP